ncbi:MAG: sigma 54-interacting transcriptional regulator [Myxococcota bacterium]|nr:sigma 54-interacting transcriptional regulator [Myxococcota bacterium]
MSSPSHPDEILTHPGEEPVPEVVEALRIAPAHTQVLETGTTLRLSSFRLEVVEGPDSGRELSSAGPGVRVGAGNGCDLILREDGAASRQHFEIQRTDRGYLLVDLGSTNGTFLDGRQVERAYLGPEARISVGKSTLRFVALEEELQLRPVDDTRLGGMVGRSLKMRQLFALLKKVASLNLGVLVQGETGTGKELVARALHQGVGPLVVVDCAALPPEGLERELFGAPQEGRGGALQRAHGGTLFLDEVGELPLELQPKLLRLLEGYGPVDGEPLRVRVVASTHRDLVREVAAGSFRQDLYFRLAVIPVQLPPLRQRMEDLPLLLSHALEDPERVAKTGPKQFTPSALNLLAAYSWPGNVRELFNVVSHVATLTEGQEIDVAHLPARVRGTPQEVGLSFNEHLSFKDAKERLLEAFEREYLGQLLKRCEGNVSRAARESGLHRKSIERLMKKYQLDAKALRGR